MKISSNDLPLPARDTLTVGGVTIGPTEDGGLGTIGGGTPTPLTPIDRAPGGTAEVPFDLGSPGGFPVVEDKSIFSSTTSVFTVSVPMPATVVAGEVLLVFLAHRIVQGGDLTWPVGWELLVSEHAGGSNGFVHEVRWKLANGSEGGTTVDVSTNAATGKYAHAVYRISGAGTPEAADSGVFAGGSTPDPPSLAPTFGVGDTLWIAQHAILNTRSTTGFPASYSDTQSVAGAGLSPMGMGSCQRNLAASPEDPAAFTLSGTTNGVATTVAIPTTGGVIWLDAPVTVDNDDDTFEFVYNSQTDVWRIDLGAEYAIASARLRLGIENAGSVTYEIQAATLADFSDATTVASETFAATGTYTAQDVEFAWTSTGAFRYWKIIGPAENRNVYSVELYEAVVSASADLTTHIADPTDAHDASAVSYDGTASGLAATDVQAAIDEVVAGGTLVVADDGTPLATTAAAVDFVGPLVTASGSGATKTVTIAGALNDLSDVAIVSAASKHTVRHDGSFWINDATRWEPVTSNFGTGPELVWDGDDLVMEWKAY